MSLVAAIVTKLNASAGVTALLATHTKNATKAIRPDRLSQHDPISQSLGGIAVSIDDVEYATDTEGAGKTGTQTIVIACVALTSTTAHAIADQVEDALENWRGATAAGTVQACHLSDRRGDWATTDDGDDAGEYVVELQMTVLYTRS